MLLTDLLFEVLHLISVPKLANVDKLCLTATLLNTKSLDLKSILTSDFKLKTIFKVFQEKQTQLMLWMRADLSDCHMFK